MTGWLRNYICHLVGRPRPAVLLAALTHRCNLRCKYCGIWKDSFEEMETSRWVSLLEESVGVGTLAVSFCGGEPLLRSDIGELISLAQRQGLRTSLTTNGWFVIDRMDDLRDLQGITLSLDGPRDIHDGIRGKGSHQRVLDAVDWAVRSKKKVYTVTVLSRYNPGIIEYVCTLGIRMGFIPFFQPATPYAFSRDFPERWELAPEELRNLAHLLRNLKSRNVPVGNSYAYPQYLERSPDSKSRLPCSAGRSFLTVLPDGHLVPCHMCPEDPSPINGNQYFLDAYSKITPPACGGCAIAPYFEYDRVLGHLDLKSILSAFLTLSYHPGNDRSRITRYLERLLSSRNYIA